MSGGFNRLLEAVVRIDVREVTFEQGARRFVAGVNLRELVVSSAQVPVAPSIGETIG